MTVTSTITGKFLFQGRSTNLQSGFWPVPFVRTGPSASLEKPRDLLRYAFRM